MKKHFFAVLLLILAMMPLQLTNTYLRCDTFESITVQKEETVWSLAARYEKNAEHAKELREAIIEINGLNSEGGLRAGQTLLIPVMN